MAREGLYLVLISLKFGSIRSLSLSSQVPTIFLLSGQVIQASHVNKVNHLNQTNQGGSSEPNKVKQVLLLLGVHHHFMLASVHYVRQCQEFESFYNVHPSLMIVITYGHLHL